VALWNVGGLFASLLAYPLSMLLLTLMEGTDWHVMIRGGGLLGSILLVPTGAVVGKLRDLGQRLQRELAARDRAEEALREAEVRFRTVADFTFAGEYWEEPDGTLCYVAPACERISGYAADRFLDNPLLLHEIVLHEDREAWAQHRHQATEAPGLREVQFRIRRGDGETRWIEHACQPVVDQHGTFLGFRSSNRDITECKQAEERVQRQSTLFEAINQVFREALTCEAEAEVAHTCHRIAEELTGSQFGFVGELNQAGLFDTMAISNPGWDACKMPDSEATKLIKNMELRGVDRSVVREGKSRIVNDPASHPDRVGVPEGHPPVNAFLGVPLQRAGRTIGMIGLANREGGYSLADQEAVEALSAAFVEALMGKRAEEVLERRINELSALNSVATIVNESHEVEEILNRAMDETLKLVGVEAGAMLLLDEEAGELAIVAHRGLSDEFVRASSRMKLSEGLAGRAAQTGQPAVMHHLGEYPGALKAFVEKERIQSGGSVPMIGSRGVIGTMNNGANLTVIR